jgi:hypothetical protein
MGSSTRLTVAFLLFLIPLTGFSELVCERPDGCRWIGSTCQDCIEKPPPPKPERKVPSKIIHNNYEIHISSEVTSREYIVTRPPTIQFSNPSVILSGLSRDSSGWRFRAKVNNYECLMPPLRPGDISGNFSCGGTPTNYFVFF